MENPLKKGLLNNTVEQTPMIYDLQFDRMTYGLFPYWYTYLPRPTADNFFFLRLSYPHSKHAAPSLFSAALQACFFFLNTVRPYSCPSQRWKIKQNFTEFDSLDVIVCFLYCVRKFVSLYDNYFPPNWFWFSHKIWVVFKSELTVMEMSLVVSNRCPSHYRSSTYTCIRMVVAHSSFNPSFIQSTNQWLKKV